MVDEERILYAQGLEPQVDTLAEGLFGVRLNLSDVDATHRNPRRISKGKEKA